MAFTTINGASATDRVSFVGTDGVDNLITFSTLTAFVGAQEANDSITASNVNGLVDWQIKAGTGNDNVDLKSSMIGGRLNGNAGSDVISLNKVLDGAEVFGGQNNDSIATGVVANSRINGNLGEDVITVGKGFTFEADDTIAAAGIAEDVLFASIFGGQGNDTIRILTNDIRSSIIDGNLGDDKIRVYFNQTASVTALTVNGGAGSDNINILSLSDPTEKNGGEGLEINGGEGNDIIKASGRNDSISGGEGIDTIEGRGGADTLTGGLGVNTFNVKLANQTWIKGTGTDPIEATDVITDWKTSDIIGFGAGEFAFDATVYTTLAAGILANAATTGVTLIGVGTADSLTAYAVVIDTAAGGGSAADATALTGIGAIQLGATGIYRTTNIGAVMSVGNVQAYA